MRREGRSPSTGPVDDPMPRNEANPRTRSTRSRIVDFKGPVLRPWSVRTTAPTPAQRWFVRLRHVTRAVTSEDGALATCLSRTNQRGAGIAVVVRTRQGQKQHLKPGSSAD